MRRYGCVPGRCENRGNASSSPRFTRVDEERHMSEQVDHPGKMVVIRLSHSRVSGIPLAESLVLLFSEPSVVRRNIDLIWGCIPTYRIVLSIWCRSLFARYLLHTIDTEHRPASLKVLHM